jgi:hypothetical protein
MAEKLTRLTHKTAIQLHLVAGSCTICSSRSRWLVRKLLDTPSYVGTHLATAKLQLVHRLMSSCRKIMLTFICMPQLVLLFYRNASNKYTSSKYRHCLMKLYTCFGASISQAFHDIHCSYFLDKNYFRDTANLLNGKYKWRVAIPLTQIISRTLSDPHQSPSFSEFSFPFTALHFPSANCI